MRACLTIVCFLSLCGVATPQEGGDVYATRLVRNFLEYPAQLGSGFGEKQLNRLGDRVSIALLKILSEQEMRKPEEIRKMLPLIRGAFIAPQIIPVEGDRTPDVTLLLLNHLKDVVQDPALKSEVSEVETFVRKKTGVGTRR